MSKIHTLQLLGLLATIFWSNRAMAQESSVIFSRGGNLYFNGPESYQYEGSPYFADDWLPAKIKLTNGNLSEQMNLMLDLFAARVIRQTNENEGEYLDKLVIDEIHFQKDGAIHRFKKIPGSFFIEGREKGLFFYEVLSTDNEYYIMEYVVKFINGEELNKGRALLNPDFSNRFETTHKYYFKLKDGQYHEFKMSKKGILKLFEKDEFPIESFLSGKKIDFKDPVQVNRVLNEYYSNE